MVREWCFDRENLENTVCRYPLKLKYILCSSPADDVFGYMGKGQTVPKDVVSVRFHPSVFDVDDDAFRNCKQLREVILNDGLLRIGSQAFEHCSSLVSITFPSSLATFDYGVFLNCKSLKRVVFNEGLRKIGNDAFRNTALQSIIIPSTVIKIGNYAFSSCKSLIEIVLNEGLEEIGGDAFSFCRSLQSIILPSTVTEIGGQIFFNCKSLRGVVLHNGLIRIGNNAFRDCNSLRSVELPSTVNLLKEATTLFELALWKARIDQSGISSPAERAAYRVDVPGPVKDTILQYLYPADAEQNDDSMPSDESC